MSETIAAVVVTYNRKKLLMECLGGLIHQTRKLDCIYIIDNNSNDGTFISLKENHFISENEAFENYEYYSKKILKLTDKSIVIIYIRLYENTGSSGGQYEGIINASKDGYDWVWLMDDDVEPKHSSLEKMITSLKNRRNENIACVVPLREYDNGDIVYGHEKILTHKFFSKSIYKKPYNDFIERMTLEGPLIKVEEALKASTHLQQYFILYDDVDLAYKISRNKKIYFDITAIMIKKIRIPREIYKNGSEWKQYYRYRNLLVFAKNNFSYNFIIPLIYHYLREIMYVIYKRKFKYIAVLYIALLDVINGNIGKTFTPDNHPWK